MTFTEFVHRLLLSGPSIITTKSQTVVKKSTELYNKENIIADGFDNNTDHLTLFMR